jgi:hypothetical protein
MDSAPGNEGVNELVREQNHTISTMKEKAMTFQGTR